MNDQIRDLEEYASRWRAEQPPTVVDWSQVTSRTHRAPHWLPVVASLAVVALAVTGTMIGVSLTRSSRPAEPAGSTLGVDHTTELIMTAVQPLSQADRDSAVRVMRNRLHVLGVEGSVASSGQHFFLSVPTTEKDLAASVSRRGELQLRPVLAEVADAPSKPAFVYFPLGTAGDLATAEQLFADRHCGDQPSRPDNIESATEPNSYLVMCSQNAATKYLLAPSAIDSTDVASATPHAGQNGSDWLMDVTFTDDGATAWQQLTAQAARRPRPPDCQPPSGCNGIGMLIDGRLISVPSIGEGVSGRTVQISPLGSRDEARGLAAAITTPLPVQIELSSERAVH